MHLPSLALIASVLLALPPARAGELLQNGSFEKPEVPQRTLVADGGDPSISGGWHRLRGIPKGEDGEVEAGLTRSEAHTGKQAVFISFREFGKIFGSGHLSTPDIPVIPGQSYQVSIWGKLDAKDPLSVDAGRINIRADVFFMKADGSRLIEKWLAKTAAGAGGQRFFDEVDWRLYTIAVEAPPEAAKMRVVWACQLDGKNSKANGTILLDDASIEGPPAP